MRLKTTEMLKDNSDCFVASNTVQQHHPRGPADVNA